MLKVENLEVSYGSIRAIKGISFEVHKGEIVTLIGANGAGKTTTLHAISGLLPSSGKVIFNNEDISNMLASNIVKKGMAHVPEGRRVFANMTIQENLEMGAVARKETHQNLKKDYELVYSIFPRLAERKKQMAGTLSGGEQQMLAIGRAIMSKPDVLLLDEPSMGLSPLLVEEIFKTIRMLNDDGITILLVEQNAKIALSIANRGYVLETGKVVMSGEAKVIRDNPEIKKAYLGGA